MFTIKNGVFIVKIAIFKITILLFRCCEGRSKTVHEIATVFYNSSDAANSTFCLNMENKLSKSESINCKDKAQIYEFNQYDIHNNNGVGRVALSEKFRRTASKSELSNAKPGFRFNISSGDYCVSFDSFVFTIRVSMTEI